jgi:hypothetical protein
MRLAWLISFKAFLEMCVKSAATVYAAGEIEVSHVVHICGARGTQGPPGRDEGKLEKWGTCPSNHVQILAAHVPACSVCMVRALSAWARHCHV